MIPIGSIPDDEEVFPKAISVATSSSVVDHEQTLEFTQLGKKLLIDIAAGAGASFLVSPFVTILDRAIIENAAGVSTLSSAAKRLTNDLFRNPIEFLQRREFKIVYGLYAATYVAVNSTETVCEWQEMDNSMPKLVATTAVNMPLCVLKDRALAQMFGAIAPTKFPLTSLGLFAIRDSMTVGSSFNTPHVAARKLEQYGGIHHDTALKVSQFVCPAIAQLLSAPMHLIGLNLYNHKGASVTEHASFIKKQYLRTSVARIARIIPAFGVGGIGNRTLRHDLRQMFVTPKPHHQHLRA
jgi:hypothetical protein